MRLLPPTLTVTDPLLAYTTLLRSKSQWACGVGCGLPKTTAAAGIAAAEKPALPAAGSCTVGIGPGPGAPPSSSCAPGPVAAETAISVTRRRSEAPRRSLINCLPEMAGTCGRSNRWRSEEHTSELQSLMRISYAVFCL